MVAQLSQALRQSFVACHHRAGVAVSAEQLRRVEAERSRQSPAAAAHAHVRAAQRLGSVLEHEQVVGLRDLHHPVHAHQPAVQVHRHDRPGSWRDRRLQLVGVHVVVVADVDQDRRRSDLVDDRHRGHERVRDRDDLVTGSDADRFQQQSQAIRAVGHADPVGGADERGEVALEIEHLLAHDQVARGEHAAHRGHHLFLDAQEFLARFPEPN